MTHPDSRVAVECCRSGCARRTERHRDKWDIQPRRGRSSRPQGPARRRRGNHPRKRRNGLMPDGRHDHGVTTPGHEQAATAESRPACAPAGASQAGETEKTDEDRALLTCDQVLACERPAWVEEQSRQYFYDGVYLWEGTASAVLPGERSKRRVASPARLRVRFLSRTLKRPRSTAPRDAWYDDVVVGVEDAQVSHDAPIAVKPLERPQAVVHLARQVACQAADDLRLGEALAGTALDASAGTRS